MVKKEEELEFKRKVELTIKTIIFFILKVFLAGSIILIIIAIFTSNSALVYPTYEKTNDMLIQIFVLGGLFMVVYGLVKEHQLKKKKK